MSENSKVHPLQKRYKSGGFWHLHRLQNQTKILRSWRYL